MNYELTSFLDGDIENAVQVSFSFGILFFQRAFFLSFLSSNLRTTSKNEFIKLLMEKLMNSLSPKWLLLAGLFCHGAEGAPRRSCLIRGGFGWLISCIWWHWSCWFRRFFEMKCLNEALIWGMWVFGAILTSRVVLLLLFYSSHLNWYNFFWKGKFVILIYVFYAYKFQLL